MIQTRSNAILSKLYIHEDLFKIGFTYVLWNKISLIFEIKLWLRIILEYFFVRWSGLGTSGDDFWLVSRGPNRCFRRRCSMELEIIHNWTILRKHKFANKSHPFLKIRHRIWCGFSQQWTFPGGYCKIFVVDIFCNVWQNWISVGAVLMSYTRE